MKKIIFVIIPILGVILFACGTSTTTTYPIDGGQTSCYPETDIIFCSNYHTACGAISSVDNCGTTRSVKDCGSCSGNNVCLFGSCVVNSNTTCTSFTYTPYGPCQPNGTQTRQLSSSSPSGCSGGNPSDLTASCLYVPPALQCSSFTYTDWSNCQSNGTQFRSVVSSFPVGCSGGSPDLVQNCTVCQPETNATFCAHAKQNCGSFTGTDNCGSQRTVSSCGSLQFNGVEQLDIAGGVPLEMASANSIHISAWVNMSVLPEPFHVGGPPPTNIINLGTFNLGITFNGFLTLNGYQSNIILPLNQWVYVFADSPHYLVNQNTIGLIYQNNLSSYAFGPTPFAGNNLVAGNPASLGVAFKGQMNNVRLWSTSLNDINTNYHDCFPAPTAGMIRQWCMLEGAGATITDSVSGNSSLLNTASWVNTCN